MAAQRGNGSQLPLPEIRLLHWRREKGESGAPSMRRATGLARRSTEKTCDRAVGICGSKSPGQVGLTSQTPAPSFGERSRGARRCRAVLAGWLACGRAGCWRGLGSDSLSHLAKTLWGAAWRFPEDICASAAPASGTGCGSGFPMHGTLCIWLFSFHCCSGQASRSSFHFIKRASAPPPTS